MPFHALHICANALDFLALFGFCGLAVARVWLIPHSVFGLPDFCLRWRRMLGACLAVLVLSGGAILLIRTAEMGSNSFAGAFSGLPAVLLETHFGKVWMLHLSVLLALGALWAVPASRFPGAAWPPALVMGMLLLTFSYSASSQAGERGDFTLAELNDWLHVIATSVWGGCILVAVWLVLPVLRKQYALVSGIVLRLSGLSAAALALVLATGLYNASLRLHSLDELGSSDYGRILAVKLILIGFLMLVGALNRFFIIPCLIRYPADADKYLRQVGIALAVDAVLVLLVLLASATLVQGIPPLRASTL